MDPTEQPAPLPAALDWSLEIVEIAEVTPEVRRLRLRGDGLEKLDYRAGQDLMFTLEREGDGPVRRRYTIRRFDPTMPAVDVEIVLHGDGPGARWTAGATVGEMLDVVGPRGKITLDRSAAWHVFAGDESALPAIFAMVEALGPGAIATAFIEVASDADHQEPAVVPGVDLSVRWLHRAGEQPGQSRVLPEALGQLDLPKGRGHGYLSGELRVVNAMRLVLLDKGMAPEQLSPKPYWRLGRANERHGEPLRD